MESPPLVSGGLFVFPYSNYLRSMQAASIKPLKIFKSSAGSGKTFSLVKEYLKLCLVNPENNKKVVAITFTKAAAAEMKQRILSTLEGIAEGKNESYVKILLNEGLTAAHIANAEQLLHAILTNYSRFNISTIDSFFHNILRSFGKELGLPMGFEIFLEQEEAIDYAVEKLLNQSFEYPEAKETLLRFINEKINDAKTWDLKQDLKNIASEMIKDNAYFIENPDPETLKEFISTLSSIKTYFENSMDTLGKSILKKIEAHGYEPTDFLYGKSGVWNYFNKIQKSRKEYVPTDRTLAALSSVDAWTKKDAAASLSSFISGELWNEVEQINRLLEVNHAQYLSALEVLRHIYTFSVYGKVKALLDDYREEKQVVLISDFNKILAKHLREEDISFIYSKIGARYEHFLIDEFQDTSQLQYANLFPLIDNAVSSNSTCIFVGDGKQAIYRWRGGKVELIETTVKEDFSNLTENISLQNNFRSANEIIRFNNQLFTQLGTVLPEFVGEKQIGTAIYSDVTQSPTRKEETGYVTAAFYIDKTEDEEADAPTLSRMNEKIQEVLQRGYSYADIAILIRDKIRADKVTTFLQANGIPFISQDTLKLTNSPLVKLLLSALRFLQTPNNSLAITELCMQWQTGSSPKVLKELLDNIKDHPDKLNKHLPPDFISSMEALKTFSIYEMMEEMIRLFKLNGKADTGLVKLLDIAYDFTNDTGGGIVEFLEFMEAKTFNIPLPETANAIRIVTFHRAKGLEFPVVIMPYCNWEWFNKTPDLIWVSPTQENEPFSRFDTLPIQPTKRLEQSTFSNEYEEERKQVVLDNVNLIYVALTRAAEEMHLLIPVPKKQASEVKSASALLEKLLIKEGERETILTYGNPSPCRLKGSKNNTKELTHFQKPGSMLSERKKGQLGLFG